MANSEFLTDEFFEIFLVQLSRSGKVRMEIGGVSFCVDQGCDTFFQQDMTLCFEGIFR